MLRRKDVIIDQLEIYGLYRDHDIIRRKLAGINVFENQFIPDNGSQRLLQNMIAGDGQIMVYGQVYILSYFGRLFTDDLNDLSGCIPIPSGSGLLPH